MWRRVWIGKRELKTGTTYCLRWHDDNGRVRTEAVGPIRKLAAELQHKRERQLNAGELRTTAKVTYEEFKSEETEVMKGQLVPGSVADLERALRFFGNFFVAAESCARSRRLSWRSTTPGASRPAVRPRRTRTCGFWPV